MIRRVTTYFNQRSWLKGLFFIILPLIPVAIAFMFYYREPLNLFHPSEKQANVLAVDAVVFDDRSEKGNSECTYLPGADRAGFKYTLRKGFAYPYAGITFFSTEGRNFDFTKYDYVRIRIKASKGRKILITLPTYIENYSRPEDFNTLMCNQYMLYTSPEEQEITFGLKDMYVPEWWYVRNKSDMSFGMPDFAKVRSVNITNCKVLPEGIGDSVYISEISLHINMAPFYIGSGIFLAFCYALMALIFFRKKKRSGIQLHFQYEKTETVNVAEKEESLIFDYLASGYSRPELSITELQQATGISEQKISAVIRRKSGMNFKQFLNKLRITEAKRLLKETDLQVSEIAFQAGYGNVSHFNRVFKEHEHCSPNEFRKQQHPSVPVDE